MKKILAMLTVIVMLGCMLSVTAFADGGYVPSPKHDDNTDTTPTSPQTGYDLGIGSVVMTIAVSGGVAYTAGLVFYALKNIRYMHSIWHLFVFAGAALHYLCILFYVM